MYEVIMVWLMFSETAHTVTINKLTMQQMIRYKMPISQYVVIVEIPWVIYKIGLTMVLTTSPNIRTLTEFLICGMHYQWLITTSFIAIIKNK